MFYSNMPSYAGNDFSEEPGASSDLLVNNGKAKIKVIGVGGAGNNAVNRMIEAGITSAEYVVVNTDAQILACNKAQKKFRSARSVPRDSARVRSPKSAERPRRKARKPSPRRSKERISSSLPQEWAVERVRAQLP